MKSTSLITLLFLALVGAAFGSTCPIASLASYSTPGFSCTIGNKTFGSFNAALVTVNGTPTSLNNITVNPSGSSTNPGFAFTGAFNAPGGLLPSSVTLALAYTGFAPASDPFTSASLSLTSPSVTGLGSIVAAKAFCFNGSFTNLQLPLICSSGVGANANLLTNITNANLNATLLFNFAPVTQLGVLDALTLIGPDILGSASLSGINNNLGSSPVPPPPPPPVPEPSSILMLGTGLISGIAAAARKWHPRQTA